jgi:hypothetical protein
MMISGMSRRAPRTILAFLLAAMPGSIPAAGPDPAGGGVRFPPPIESYADGQVKGVLEVLLGRIRKEPLNLAVTLIFFCAVLHTFFTHAFRRWAHVIEERHRERRRSPAAGGDGAPEARQEASSAAIGVLHFLGEVEVVFGIWVIPLLILLAVTVGKGAAIEYLEHGVGYHEATFVVVIMTIASTRPVLRLAERILGLAASLGGRRPAAWWLSILTFGPLLGSFITEPAAMTICASLLSRRFYALRPRPVFAYATLGLLFVDISVGGVLTHFAAPPVLMVAAPWSWDSPFMIAHFGWVAAIGIALSNNLYLIAFRKDFRRLDDPTAPSGEPAMEREAPIPFWITAVHLATMGWSVWNAHQPALLIGGFLLFLGFYEITRAHQSELRLRPAVLVGFFLAGLIIHGGLQGWWIAPVLGRLGELPLMLGAMGLTAVNDNAAITYLAALVPGMTAGMKYSVMAGAVTGGGLTVIANAPNPAGQSILARHFPDGISPLGLLLGALAPTLILAALFILLGNPG